MNTKHIENVIVGQPVAPEEFFAFDTDDWERVEKEKTLFTDERNLAKILVAIGFAPSVSEIRRNKPQLCIMLDKPDFMEVKWGKKKIWVLVGE